MRVFLQVLEPAGPEGGAARIAPAAAPAVAHAVRSRFNWLDSLQRRDDSVILGTPFVCTHYAAAFHARNARSRRFPSNMC